MPLVAGERDSSPELSCRLLLRDRPGLSHVHRDSSCERKRCIYVFYSSFRNFKCNRGLTMKKRFFLLLPLFLFFLAFQTDCAAAVHSEGDYKANISNLESLLQSINSLSRMISATQEVLHSPQGTGREQELRSQINELTRKLGEAEANFARLAADVDLSAFQGKEKRKLLKKPEK